MQVYLEFKSSIVLCTIQKFQSSIQKVWAISSFEYHDACTFTTGIVLSELMHKPIVILD